MYCKYCGKDVENNIGVCDECREKNKTEDSKATNTEASQTIHVDATVNTNTNINPKAKSKLAAGLLGIFLGALGVHNFYLGFTGKAVVQLLITILSCGFLSFISAIWGLIEGILILTGSITVDGNGEPLRD